MNYSFNDKYSHSILDYINLGQDAIIEISKNINDISENDLFDDNDRNKVYDELNEEISKLVYAEHDLKNTINAISQVENQVKELSEQDSSDDQQEFNIKEMYEEKINMINNQNNNLLLEQNDKYKRFINLSGKKAQHQNQNDDDDDELETIETVTDEIPIDPFSRKEISNPVRNKKCKHIYDYNGLKEVLNARHEAPRCPKIGCNNRKVLLNDVEEDIQLKIKIGQLKKRKLISELISNDN